MDLKGKIVWITGASSGIGEALALAMNSAGAVVVISARRGDELTRVKETCSDPARVMILPFDLAEPELFRNHVAQIIATYGRIDILVNNGGISQRALARETTEEVDQRIMSINYFSNIALTKAVLPEMRAQQEGKIVVISSIAGKFGFYLRSSYSASKHALHGYYESLRLEEEDDGISVMMVCPGRVQTNISKYAVNAEGGMHGKMDSDQLQGIPANKCATDIIKGIQNNKEEIYSGGKELMVIKLKKYLPSIFRKIIRKQRPY